MNYNIVTIINIVGTNMSQPITIPAIPPPVIYY